MNKIILRIFVTYNGMNWIYRCLSSLHSSSIKIDILIIDNNSTDDTVAFVESNFPTVEIKTSNQNLGFDKANNIDFKHALLKKYELILTLNQDCQIHNTAIENILKYVDENVGIISPIHLNGKGVTLGDNFYSYDKADTCPNNLLMDSLLNKKKDCYNWGFINAVCWLLPIKTLNIVGGLKPLFKHYGENNEFVYRIHFHSLQIKDVSSLLKQHYL